MNVPRQWQQDRFFKGFLATMVTKGISSVETHEGTHQRRFAVVVEKLKTLREQTQGAQYVSIPRTFVRSQITGQYKDFDVALIALQNGLLSAQNPYYKTVSINCSPALAEQIVAEFSADEQQLFKQLVDVWRSESTEAA